MEPNSVAAVTLASILSSLPAPGQTESYSVISTHISPAIAGQWEIELSVNDTGIEHRKEELLAPQVGQAGSKDPLSDAAHTPLPSGSVVTLAETDATHPDMKGSAGAESADVTTSPVTDNKAAHRNTTCRELYNFGNDNQLLAVSGAEWTYGKYLVTHTGQGLPIIAIRTLYDNNEVDCSGNQVDQTGEALVAYLKHEGNQMQWCSDPEGETCFMKFDRVLP